MSNVAEVPKEPQMVEKKPDIPFASRDSFLRGPPPKTADVVVQGYDGPEKVRLRELKQAEIEAISTAAYKQAEDGDGKLVKTYDFEGNKARYVAFALVDPTDGRNWFSDPMNDWRTINKALPVAAMDLLYKATQRLNGLDEETQKELKKASGTTGSSKA